MIVILLGGALVSLSVLVILRPLALGASGPLTATAADMAARNRLLRQLQDLDDDLASGKLESQDYARLRDPLEREVADELRLVPGGLARPGGGAVARAAATGGAVRPSRAPATRPRPKGFRGPAWVAGVVAATAATLAIGLLLAASVAPRAPGATMTGAAAAPVPAPSGSPQGSPRGSAGTGSRAPQAGSEQLAAVAAAETGVKANPRDPQAHLALARAYTAAAAPQLAAIEYLAVTRLDPSNPEANAALALVALAAGQPEQAKALVDTALAAHPSHPEALYARGLVELMGLGQVAAGRRDLDDYLAAAPYGSHRAAVETLLAMIPKGAPK